MEISGCKVFKTANDMFVANGSIEFDNQLFVKFKIVKSPKDASLFVSWPATKGKDKEGKDTWYPDAGFVIGEDEDTKYNFKNETDAYIIKEYHKIVGMPSTTPDALKDKSEPKKKVSITFKEKDGR